MVSFDFSRALRQWSSMAVELSMPMRSTGIESRPCPRATMPAPREQPRS